MVFQFLKLINKHIISKHHKPATKKRNLQNINHPHHYYKRYIYTHCYHHYIILAPYIQPPPKGKFEIGSIDDNDKNNNDDDDDEDEELELGQNVINKQKEEEEELEKAKAKEEEEKKQKQEKEKDGEEEKQDDNKDVDDDDDINFNEITTTRKKTITRSGLRPYIQIFKNAKLIFSSRRKNSRLKFYDESDGHIKFEVNREIEDVLIEYVIK